MAQRSKVADSRVPLSNPWRLLRCFQSKLANFCRANQQEITGRKWSWCLSNDVTLHSGHYLRYKRLQFRVRMILEMVWFGWIIEAAMGIQIDAQVNYDSNYIAAIDRWEKRNSFLVARSVQMWLEILSLYQSRTDDTRENKFSPRTAARLVLLSIHTTRTWTPKELGHRSWLHSKGN